MLFRSGVYRRLFIAGRVIVQRQQNRRALGAAAHGGAGTLVPITGFANAMVSPALEFKSEGLVTGVAAKMFTIAGPVLVFGISASVAYGLLLVLFGLN